MSRNYFKIAVIFCLFSVYGGVASASTAEDLFTKALDTLDYREADAYLNENSDKVAFEIDKLLALVSDEDTGKKDRRRYLRLANAIAESFQRVKGEGRYLAKVKGKYIDEKLGRLIRPDEEVTIHNVVIKDKAFHPDNLVIKQGQTVIWTNKDVRQYTVISLLDVGPRVIMSQRLVKDGSYKFTFNESGEYYYNTIVYKKMYGKITVLPRDDEAGGESEKAVEEEIYNDEITPAAAEEAVEEEVDDEVPAASPKESSSDKDKRRQKLLEKFGYEPDEPSDSKTVEKTEDDDDDDEDEQQQKIDNLLEKFNYTPD